MPLASAVRHSLQAIKANAHLNAFVAVQTEQKLLAEAAAASSRISGGNNLHR
jgi:Asp-tRNA(Asn)/Glu-tRNA(Gln) amidotransferase A subunit family amidase